MAADETLQKLRPKISALLRSFPDFPKTGVLFRLPVPIQAVAALEARGFLFGPQIAAALNVPFIVIRKKGKLPGETIQTSYVKEYGEDVIEIQKDALEPGTAVFIFDDLLATGGSMSAAIKLIQKAGGKVAEAFCMIELTDLNGRKMLGRSVPVYTLIQF